MKFPKLVNSGFTKTWLHVTLYAEEITEDGAPIIALDDDFRGNWQDGAKTILTKEQKKVQISGRVYIDGDAAPCLSEITDGIVTVFGVDRKLAMGRKHRNPDGTVNYTELDVM